LYLAQGRTAEAAVLQEEVLEKRQRILGAEHPNMLTSMLHLASSYLAQGRTAEAAALQEEVLEKQRRILGAEHPDTDIDEQPRNHLPGSGQDSRGGSVAGGGAGEAAADPGSGASPHAHIDEQPRNHIPGSGHVMEYASL
jgi:hypothetical protein